jgi:hypothetical protein
MLSMAGIRLGSAGILLAECVTHGVGNEFCNDHS